jgi:hypothetical protein
MLAASSLAAIVLVATTAAAAPRGCPGGLRPASTAELFFGRETGWTGQVSDADWRSFLDAEVTPRFPDGLSVDAVYGARLSPAGAFARQKAKGLLIVLTGRPDERQGLDRVRGAYERRFHLPAVLRVNEQACVGF